MVANGTPRTPFRIEGGDHAIAINFNNGTLALNTIVARSDVGCPYTRLLINNSISVDLPVRGANTISKAQLTGFGLNTLADITQWTLGA